MKRALARAATLALPCTGSAAGAHDAGPNGAATTSGRFKALTSAQRSDLIAYLNTL